MRSRQLALDALVEVSPLIQRAVSHMPPLIEAEFGISPNRAQVLGAIANDAGRVQSVAEMTWTSMSAASRTIDSLVQEGLVERLTDPQDRRATMLRLTDDGQALLEQIEQWRHDLFAEVVDELSGELVLRTARGLKDVSLVLEEVLMTRRDRNR